MNNLKNNLIVLLALATTLSCGFNTPTEKKQKEPIFNQSNEINQNKIVQDSKEIYEIEVSKDEGASFFVSIPNVIEGFEVKANANGYAGKTVTDISNYIVYLIKNSASASYPLNGDPLGTTDFVRGPFNISASNDKAKVIKFTNVPPSGTDSYYVALRAQDGTNADLIKDNNGSGTAWTGDTTGITSKVAVSIGSGISVSDSYVISSTNPLRVEPQLIDGVGARIDSDLSVTGGSSPLSGNITAPTNGVKSSLIYTVAGNGTSGTSGDSGQATSAQLSFPESLALDNSKNLYIGHSNKIRKVNVETGIISTFTGTGTAGFSGDGGSSTDAEINTPTSLSFDENNNLYISEGNNRVRKIDSSTNIISTFAGTGTGGFTGDNGQATDAQINNPDDILVSENYLYISDFNNNRVRRINLTTNIISTFAGTGTGGFTGDNGQATDAQIESPTNLAADNNGNIYVAVGGSFGLRIRKINLVSGIITTVAGTGIAGIGGGSSGDATDNNLNNIIDISIDNSNNLYLAEFTGKNISKVDLGTGTISTITAQGNTSFNDGIPITDADLNDTRALANDSNNNLYTAESNKVRKVAF